MKDTEIEIIIVKFLNKEANFHEFEILEAWLKEDRNHNIFNRFVKTQHITELYMAEYDVHKAKKLVKEKLEFKAKKQKHQLYRKIAVAASVAIIVGFTLFRFYNTGKSNDVLNGVQQNKVVNTIKTGSSKATLTLNDGEEIALTKKENFNTAGIKSNGEELIYDTENQKNSLKNTITYNYLTIPRGGQYSVQLADGTKVWLNSESKLKYPVAFVKGQIREVTLLYGEAYFEVSPSTAHQGDSFRVYSGIQEVEVLGTEFNIKAYQDESNIYTTLVEGKVAVNNAIAKINLQPNEQSVLGKDGINFTVSVVDAYSETLWKKGLFGFQSKSLKEIAKVLSRWYDIEIVFENKALETIQFKGVLNKKQDIEEILSIIKSTNFINNYEIKEKTIYIK